MEGPPPPKFLLIGTHDASLASLLLREMTKPSSNRSHQFSYTNHSKSATSNKDSLSKPDDGDRQERLPG